jgi:Phage terminase-like protein, large subunit
LLEAIKKDFALKRYDKQTELDFYTKRMNRPRTREEMPVTSRENLEATMEHELPDLFGWSCTVGIDYAMLRDWAAVNVHFWQDETRYDFGRYWVCTQSPDINRIKPNWRLWEQCVEVDDVQISPFTIAAYIQEIGQKYNIKMVLIDNFRHALLAKALDDIGFSADRNNLYLTRPSDVMKIQPVIDSCFNNHNFVWGDNPPLRWATNNTKLIPSGRKEGTDTGNYYYGKIEPKSRKTDPFMALVSSMIGEHVLYTAPTTYADLPVIGF